jgi:hypothetical protein
MGIDLAWEDETGKSLESVGDPRNLFAHALENTDLSGTICLRFIDRYGNTVFNQAQIPVLEKELALLERNEQVEAVIALVQKAKELHTYLKFYGD